jgi:hypothetical protein
LKAEEIRPQVEPSLLSRSDVTGVSVVEGKLRVYVEGTNDIPRYIKGVEVEVFKTGRIVPLSLTQVPWIIPALAEEEERTSRIRPAKGGCSVGHPSITAGTLGFILNLGGRKYGVSNNHVLAAGTTVDKVRASLGDPIIQPGTYDGGTVSDSIGYLSWFKPLNPHGENLIDAAIFEASDVSEEILGIGTPTTNFKKAVVGDIVQKSGRTTGVTQGEVLDVDATIKVDYGTEEVTFTNQIITEVMAKGGDSGSLLLKGLDPVGLLFAGSDYVTAHNHIGNVLAEIAKSYPTPVTPISSNWLLGLTAGAVGTILWGAFKKP